MGQVSAFSAAATAAQAYSIATQSAWVRLAGADVFVQAGVTVETASSTLLQAAPQLFVPLQLTTYP